MKTLLLSIACALFAALALQPRAAAQDFPGDNSIDTLHAAITKSAYVYVKGMYNLAIKFKGNGTGEQTDWKFKWHSKDAQTIELIKLDMYGKPTDQKATLVFSADYSTFTCTDVDGITKVTGHLAAQ